MLLDSLLCRAGGEVEGEEEGSGDADDEGDDSVSEAQSVELGVVV